MSMSIYEIDAAILNCIDEETGEIIDFAQLEQLQIERSTKIENIACWIKNLESDATAIKAEADNLIERAKKAQNKAADLRVWLSDILAGQKFDSARCAVSFRKSEKIEIEDETAIPRDYMITKTTYSPDKTAIKNMIKSGTVVPGCKLVQNLNAQIK